MINSKRLKACVRQDVNDVIENQASTIESYNKMMTSTRVNRGPPSEVLDVDRLTKNPTNLAKSQLISTNPGNEGAATMDARFAYFVLRNSLPPSLSECPKLKLIIEGAKHLPNWNELTTRKLVVGPLLD